MIGFHDVSGSITGRPEDKVNEGKKPLLTDFHSMEKDDPNRPKINFVITDGSDNPIDLEERKKATKKILENNK